MKKETPQKKENIVVTSLKNDNNTHTPEFREDIDLDEVMGNNQ